jgi:hypothetical protein
MFSLNSVITKFLKIYMPGMSKHMACMSNIALVNFRPTLFVTRLTLCHQPVSTKHTSTWHGNYTTICAWCIYTTLRSWGAVPPIDPLGISLSDYTSTSTISLYSLSHLSILFTWMLLTITFASDKHFELVHIRRI